MFFLYFGFNMFGSACRYEPAFRTSAVSTSTTDGSHERWPSRSQHAVLYSFYSIACVIQRSCHDHLDTFCWQTTHSAPLVDAEVISCAFRCYDEEQNWACCRASNYLMAHITVRCAWGSPMWPLSRPAAFITSHFAGPPQADLQCSSPAQMPFHSLACVAGFVR